MLRTVGARVSEGKEKLGHSTKKQRSRRKTGEERETGGKEESDSKSEEKERCERESRRGGSKHTTKGNDAM